MMTIESTLSGGFDMHTGLNVLEAYPLTARKILLLDPVTSPELPVKDANLSGL